MKLKASPQTADTLLQVAVATVKARKKAGASHQQELERCAESVDHWINRWVQTYDPRNDPYHMPFKLYAFQREYLQWLEGQFTAGQDTFTEKSRDMGCSWIHLARMLHRWLFAESYQALIGSRKQDLVDNWQLDSLFGKLAYMVDHLPEWMLPKGYDPRKHRQYMKLVNPASGNAIIGESANENFSRQGRYTEMLLDEFGFWPWAKSVWTATADAAPVRHVVTTASPGSFAKELRNSGKILIRTLHWSAHPHKTQQWYQEERQRRTDEDVSRELDINWAGAIQGLVYGEEWAQVPKGDFPYQPGWSLFTWWDFGLSDETALVWAQQNPSTRKWRLVDCHQSNGRTIDWYAPFCNGALVSGLPYEYREADLRKIDAHSSWPGAIHFGDPAGRQRNQVTGSSVVDELRKFNIHVRSRPDMNTFEARWQTTKLFLRRIEGVNMPDCAMLDDCMSNARFPERREGSQATGEIHLPIHDFTSHFRTAVEYGAVNEPKPAQQERPAPYRSIPSWEKHR